MGLFKNVANFVTGGAAEVQVSLVNPVLGDEHVLTASINVKPTGDTIHAKRLYLIVQAVEESSTANQLFSEEYIIEEGLQVNSGDQKEWTYEINLPSHVSPTYLAKHFSVKWMIKAALDMPGIDPNSGWQPFVLNKEIAIENLRGE